MSRRAKGRRPYFFDNYEVDMLLSMLMAVAGELAVTRDRLDTMERLIERHGLFDRDEIEAFTPDDQVQARREAWREEYLERVMRIVRHDMESQQADESDKGYESVIEELTRA